MLRHADLQVSLSLSEASRAMASVGPRPIATRLLATDQRINQLAPIERGRGSAADPAAARSHAPRLASSVQAAVRRSRAASVATNVLLAATLSSGRHRSAKQYRRRGPAGRPSHSRSPPSARLQLWRSTARATRSSLLPDCEIARHSWSSRRSRRPIDAGDVGRGLGHGDSNITFDQVLAEGRCMGRAAARTGDNDPRRPPLKPPDKLCQWLR